MCKCKCRLGFIFICKSRQFIKHVDQLFFHQQKSLFHHNNIRIISHITAGSSKMDDACCLRALLSISIYMAHNIMTHLFFPCLCHFIINVLCMCLKLVNLFFCDHRLSILRKAKLHFCFGQSNPKLSPGPKLHVGRKNILHFPAGIPFR